jgi:hypothetical protein
VISFCFLNVNATRTHRHHCHHRKKNKQDARVDLEEYKAFYGRQADAHGADAAVAMLAALEACLPAALHSAAYAHLSHLSKADEARRGLVDAGLAALTEAQALMTAEAKVEAAASAAVATAQQALQGALAHDAKDAKAEAKDDPSSSASVSGGLVARQVAVASAALAEAQGKLAEEAKLEAAVEEALADAVHALDDAREDAKQVLATQDNRSFIFIFWQPSKCSPARIFNRVKPYSTCTRYTWCSSLLLRARGSHVCTRHRAKPSWTRI